MPTLPQSPGGLTTTGICAPSPTDMAGTIGNILERLEAIELVLSAVLGGDVTAAQLADISEAAGILSQLATASNAAGGWITSGTYTGVAISTTGWVMSDGSTFPIVVMEDGVLQYGFGGTDADGDFVPMGGAMASAQNIAILTTNDPILATTTSNSSENAASITSDYDPSSLVTVTGASTFTLSTTGIYLLTATCTINAYTNTGGLGTFNWSISGQPVDYGMHRANGPQVYWQSRATGSNPATQSMSRIMQIDSGSIHQLSAIAAVGSGPATIQVGGATLGIQLLRAL